LPNGRLCEKLRARPSEKAAQQCARKAIEGGNGDDVINYGMVIVGRKTLVEFRLAEIVGNIDACFQK
jgi:hypothetical protein